MAQTVFAESNDYAGVKLELAPGDADLEPGAETPSSIASTPDTVAVTPAAAVDPARPVKRKGGRKPIYATSEERKQRNRQAQAAFRERRTEYIKQLEATIKQHEDALRSLQQSHRSAADECLMLRYKNSLLERVLLEKGIDVQAELQLKSGPFTPNSVTAGTRTSAYGASAPLHQPTLGRPASGPSSQTTGIRPPSVTPYVPPSASFSANEAVSQPTPSSLISSPAAMSNKSSVSVSQGGMPSPASVIPAQAQSQHLSSGRTHPTNPHHRSSSLHYHRVSAMPGSSLGSAPPLDNSTKAPRHYSVDVATQPYSSPYQERLDHLDQEYNAHQHSGQTSSDPDQRLPDGSFGAGQFGTDRTMQIFDNGIISNPPQDRLADNPAQTSSHHTQQTAPPNLYPGQQNNFDPYDSMLDADPFGLTASMHFPTSYSFDQRAGG